MGRLDGKVAFLTGAGAGIAKATALMFAREGAKVALAEVRRDLGESAEKAVRDAGGDALFVETDVTSDEAVKRAIDATVARFGKLNVIMNCAGGSLQEDVPVHEMDIDIWHRTVALNMLHPFLTCKYAIPHMMKAGGGSIINMTSHLGLVGSIKPAYAATKGGIISFTKTLAAEYAGHGIRANAIAPGSVRTERQIKRYENKEWMLAEKMTPAAKSRQIFKKLYPFASGDPIDIANIALFLASDESRMLTGTTIAADGGRSSYLKVYTGED